MDTATKLFLYRLKEEWQFQFSVFRTAVDWTVALYIVIPSLVYSVYHYLGWWHTIPAWLDYLPFNMLVAVVFIFAWSGTIRIFLEEADQLFLIQKDTWYSAIVKLSVIYSTVFNMIITCLIFLVLTPFMLFYYHLSLWQVIVWGAFTFGLKTELGIAKQLLALRFKGWVQRIVLGLSFALASVYYRGSIAFLLSNSVILILSCLILISGLIVLLQKRLTLKGCFFEDVAREQYERMKLANLLLKRSGYYQKKIKIIRSRPLLFRNSNLLFKQRTSANALVELSLKSLLRNGENLKLYLFLLVPVIAFELTVPSSWGWVIWLGFGLILCSFVGLFWAETMDSPFVQLFHWGNEVRVTAAAKALFLMTLPGFLIVGLVFGLKNFSWLGGLGILPLGTIASYFTAKMVSLWAA
jgi:ABC-2 type transport system permease protein